MEILHNYQYKNLRYSRFLRTFMILTEISVGEYLPRIRLPLLLKPVDLTRDNRFCL